MLRVIHLLRALGRACQSRRADDKTCASCGRCQGELVHRDCGPFVALSLKLSAYRCPADSRHDAGLAQFATQHVRSSTQGFKQDRTSELDSTCYTGALAQATNLVLPHVYKELKAVKTQSMASIK